MGLGLTAEEWPEREPVRARDDLDEAACPTDPDEVCCAGLRALLLAAVQAAHRARVAF